MKFLPFSNSFLPATFVTVCMLVLPLSFSQAQVSSPPQTSLAEDMQGMELGIMVQQAAHSSLFLQWMAPSVATDLKLGMEVGMRDWQTINDQQEYDLKQTPELAAVINARQYITNSFYLKSTVSLGGSSLHGRALSEPQDKLKTQTLVYSDLRFGFGIEQDDSRWLSQFGFVMRLNFLGSEPFLVEGQQRVPQGEAGVFINWQWIAAN